jgi:hypothetical protein
VRRDHIVVRGLPVLLQSPFPTFLCTGIASGAHTPPASLSQPSAGINLHCFFWLEHRLSPLSTPRRRRIRLQALIGCLLRQPKFLLISRLPAYVNATVSSTCKASPCRLLTLLRSTMLARLCAPKATNRTSIPRADRQSPITGTRIASYSHIRRAGRPRTTTWEMGTVLRGTAGTTNQYCFDAEV